MDRYRVRASFNYSNLPPRSSSFQSKPCSQTSLPRKPPISSSSYLGRRVVDEPEISIFDAERYFNEGIIPKRSTIILNGISSTAADSCEASTYPRDSSVSSVDGYGHGRNWRSWSFRATPTASSEASWNSQSGLLSNPPNSVAVSVRAFPSNEKRKGSHSFSACRRFFGRNCECYGKKSVDVEEKYAGTKSPVRFSLDKVSTVTGVTSNTIDRMVTKQAEEKAKLKISAGIRAKEPALFSPEKPFPAEIGHRILNSGRPFVESAGVSFPIPAPSRPPAIAGGIEPARDSLEVFQPSEELAKLRRSAEFPRRPSVAGPGDDDMASDTSSDLFEIESFSMHSAYHRRESLDVFPKPTGNSATGILQFRRSLEETAPSIAPSEHYAPSEVSVEWSVTTAEGGFDRTSVANFSSAASDYDGARFVQTKHDRFGAAVIARSGGGSSKKKGTGGGLLSCRCENSVNVGPSPVRIGPEQRRAGTVVFAVKPDQGLGPSRFAMEKGRVGSFMIEARGSDKIGMNE